MSPSKHFSEIAGIIGGVGPEATNYFISLLIKLRRDDAKKDQGHIPYLTFNNPQIPDRTDFLLNKKENPLPELIHTAKILKNAGATFLVMPCNTSHSFAEEIEKAAGLKILNMIELTVRYVLDFYGTNIKVGLMATDGTISCGIYQKKFSHLGPKVKIMLPDEKSQKDIMEAIYDIKSSSVNENNSQLLYRAAEGLIKKGASVVILGCTEIPLAIPKNKRIFPMVDPMEVTAQAVITKTISSHVASTRHFWPFRLHAAKPSAPLSPAF